MDAHDVIGSAAPVLLKAELDPFEDMQVSLSLSLRSGPDSGPYLSLSKSASEFR